MRKTIIYPLIAVFLRSACGRQPSATPIAPEPTDAVQATNLPTVEATTADVQTYQNPEFGFGFSFPAGWFGPEEYVSENTLRVEIGSDRVYPYGTGLDERVYTTNNTYSIVVQYTLNNQNDYWSETFQTLQGMTDGEALSDSRGKIIRVAALSLNGFEGMEFISTLSDTAQTEAVYSRQVYLVDDQSNLISIMGSPINVVVNTGEDWRSVYTQIDETNAEIFHAVVESLTISN
jgi:hypothetical protein